MGMISLKDLAEAVGVSKAAVSYALSDNPEKQAKVSVVTRRRILEAAKRLNYQPNIMGRGFSLCRSYNIALLLPLSCTVSISGHYLGMFHGVSSGITASDYNLSVFFGCDEKFLSSVSGGRVDAAAVIARNHNEEDFRPFSSLSCPLVFLNRRIPELCTAGSCRRDYAGWIGAVMKKFMAKKVKAVTLYIRQERSGDWEIRELFRKFCSESAITGICRLREEFHPSQINPGESYIFCGSSPAIRHFLAANDQLDYVMLASTDTTKDVKLSAEKLFYHDSEAIGRACVKLLLNMIEKPGFNAEITIPLRQHRHNKTTNKQEPEF